MKILDATCGEKGIWLQKNHPLVTFMDKRKGKYYYASKDCTKVRYNVEPNIVCEWKDAPFPDNHFDMIVFDPPHIVRKETTKSSMITEYGSLQPDTWNIEIKEGVKKLFDILKPEGIFIFKWSDNGGLKINNVLKLFPYKPLFGSTKDGNWWLVFLKYDVNQKLDVKSCCYR